MSKLRSRSTSRLKAAGIAGIGVAGLLLAGTALPAFAAVAGTLSVTSGPSGGGNTLTMTTATPVFTTASPYVEFQAVTAAGSGCSTYWKAAANVTAATATPYTSTAGIIPLTAGVTRLTTSKLVIQVPSGTTQPAVALVPPQTTSKFYICVYDSNSTTASTLLSNATYSIATAPTITSGGISPVSGPALGGNTMTITGTGFISGSTSVTIGGVAATGVTVNTAGTTITATVPSHAPSAALAVAVTTTGGTVTSTAAYTYTNGIVVSPNTAVTGTAPAIDVTGAGFSALTWAADLATGSGATVATTNGSRIVLTDNSWYNTQSAALGNPTTTTGGSLFSASLNPVAQCMTPLPISDGEVICTLDLANMVSVASAGHYAITSGNVPNGTYQITVANSDATNALYSASYNYSVQSSGSTFTVAPF